MMPQLRGEVPTRYVPETALTTSAPKKASLCGPPGTSTHWVLGAAMVGRIITRTIGCMRFCFARLHASLG